MTRKVGILREHKSEWERRAPLIPHDVEKLIRRHGIQVVVQPASNRSYKEKKYEKSGAEISEDLSKCHVVLGVKEFPLEFFKPGGIYMFFSHTIKGQSHNMNMLRRLVDLGCTLIDYELVKDDMGRRLIFFGNYAGRAGMIDTLWTLGRRLQHEGFDTPFIHVKQAYKYLSLGRAKDAVRELAFALEKERIPRELRPMVFGFAGYGNVSKGAQIIFDILEPEEIEPGMLTSLSPDCPGIGLYKVVFKEEHIVESVDPRGEFVLDDYYKHPEKYRSTFERYAPHLTALVNCNYWDERYPKLLTKEYIRHLFSGDVDNRLWVIGDISCDTEGSIECTLHCTQPDAPVYVYDVDSDSARMGYEGKGPVILAVDNLPAEFPWESSMYFSGVLMNYIPDIVKADFSVSFGDLRLPEVIKKAVILHNGKFTPDFEYMKEFVK